MRYNYRDSQYDEGTDVTEKFIYDSLGRINKRIISTNRVLDKGVLISGLDCTYEFEYDSLGRKKREIIRNHKGEDGYVSTIDMNHKLKRSL